MTLRRPVAASVHRGEQAHLNAGQGAAWDCGKWGDPIYAPEDMQITSAGYDEHRDDGVFHAGNVVVACNPYYGPLHHFCHLQSIDVQIGNWVKQGEIIGHVGSTGSTYDAQGNVGTVAAAHLHYWVEQWINGTWQRIWPSTLPWASEHTADATATEEATLTDEQRAIIQRAVAVLWVNANERLAEISLKARLSKRNRRELNIAIAEIGDMAAALEGLVG